MDLPVDENGNLECTICAEVIGARRDDGTSESPVELPCGHTFGNRCIQKWRDQNNSCPVCRAPCPDTERPEGRHIRATRTTIPDTRDDWIGWLRAEARESGDPHNIALAERRIRSHILAREEMDRIRRETAARADSMPRMQRVRTTAELHPHIRRRDPRAEPTGFQRHLRTVAPVVELSSIEAEAAAIEHAINILDGVVQAGRRATRVNQPS
jgi:hypothetical protein